MSEKPFDFSIQLIGLNDSGKTTILHVLKKTLQNSIIGPTLGFQQEIISYSKSKKPIVVYDCSGEGRHRTQWPNFYSEVDAIMFVIDSSDIKRFPIVKKHLRELVVDERIVQNKIPIMIICNKEDLPDAVDKETIKEHLNLKEMKKGKGLQLRTKGLSAFQGAERLEDAMNWIYDTIQKNRVDL
jgi:small GTP-binding protein